MNITEQAYSHAQDVIEHCIKEGVFFASGLPGGYMALWSRDSMLTCLGACLAGEKFKQPFRKSLEMLRDNQSPLGQIPNAVGSYNVDRRSDVTYNTVDSSLWYIIGHYVYQWAYTDSSLLKRDAESIERARLWLSYQDPNEVKMITQLPTTDWQDAFPHKYGHVINSQALYYAVLCLLGRYDEADHLKRVVNGEIQKYTSLYDNRRGYYLPWVWKNHDGDREQETWFDSFGNLLAVVAGLASENIALNILNYIDRKKINRPYPCRALYPPIKRGDKEWHSYFDKSDSRTPHEYLNGGIWPFIGSFYVVALLKLGKREKAQHELEMLAYANKQRIGEGDWGFQEWLHGKTGKPKGNSNAYQAWTAGTYIYAFECVKQGKVLFTT